MTQIPPPAQPQPQGPAFAHNPPQGAFAPVPPKKSFWQRFWLPIVLGVGFLLLLGGCMSALGGRSASGSKDATTTAPATTAPATAPASNAPASNAPTTTAPATKPATTQKQEDGAGLNTPVKDGNLEFTVTGFQCDVEVSNYAGPITPQGHFCKLDLTAKNVGQKEATLFSSNVVLKDAKGAEYKPSDGTLMVDGVIIAKSINPGNQLKGAIYFDVPKEVVPNQALLKGDLFGKGAKVKLA